MRPDGPRRQSGGMTRLLHIRSVEMIWTRCSLSVIALCFMLPFFTFTLSSCEGSDASRTMQVTGLDLVQQHPEPIVNRTNHAPTIGRDGELLNAVDSGHKAAIAVLVVLGLALAATFLPWRVRFRAALALSVATFWSLVVLAGAVGVAGVDVGYASGWQIAMLLSVTAIVVSAVGLYRHQPVREPAPDAAGFGARFGAWVLDAMLVLVACIATGTAAAQAMGGLAVAAAVLAMIVLYRALCECSSAQATIGERAAGLRVELRGGGRIGFARAVLRAVCELADIVLLFGLGHLITGMTGGLALHDLMAGTQVTRPAADAA